MDDFQSTRLIVNCDIQVSRLNNFLTRKQFEKCVKEHFNTRSGKVKVQYGTSAQEKH